MAYTLYYWHTHWHHYAEWIYQGKSFEQDWMNWVTYETIQTTIKHLKLKNQGIIILEDFFIQEIFCLWLSILLDTGKRAYLFICLCALTLMLISINAVNYSSCDSLAMVCITTQCCVNTAYFMLYTLTSLHRVGQSIAHLLGYPLLEQKCKAKGLYSVQRHTVGTNVYSYSWNVVNRAYIMSMSLAAISYHAFHSITGWIKEMIHSSSIFKVY